MSRGRRVALLGGVGAMALALVAPLSDAVPGPLTHTPAGAATSARAAGGDSAADSSAPFEHVVGAAPGRRLRVPGGRVDGKAEALRARSPARYRYAMSVVAIPIQGRRMGVSRSRMAEMVNRIGRRMKQQTDGRVSYRFRSWTRVPAVRSRDLPCDVDRIYDRYSDYAATLRRTPDGYVDGIGLFVTPLRKRCGFAGSAMIGGDGTYLNGVLLRDRQRLQEWITAHELGHNLLLVHSGSFAPADPGWDISSAVVPRNERNQIVDEYGDYLDIMGSPPGRGREYAGNDLSRWTADAVTQLNLGALRRRDVKFVTASGVYEVAALQPGGAQEGKSVLAIPVTADRSATFWILEYRPATRNPMGYPPPWDTAGFGVRLILYEHVSRRRYHVNKVLHLGRRSTAPAVLPAWQMVRLGEGAQVGVSALGPRSATIVVTVPDDQAGAQSPDDGAMWRGLAWRG